VAQLIVRGIEAEVVDALKRRAVQRGHSAEAEHREILREALGQRPRRALKQLLLEMPSAGRDGEFARRPQRPRRVRL
jgi:plasmid stability protein